MSRGRLAIVVALTGCPAPFPEPESSTMLDATTTVPATSADSAVDGGDDGGDDAPSSAGPGESTSQAASDDADSTSDGATTVDPSTGGPDDATDGPGCVGPALPGSDCADDCECATGHCASIGLLGGMCGDCSKDSDCVEGGCSYPNPFAEPPQGTTCNTGALGDGCMSDRVCQDGLTCATILDVSGIFALSTCSQCIDDGDCGPLMCSPSIDFVAWTLANLCVVPGSLGIGVSCDHLGSGDAACQSGHCAEASLMGLLEVGVCSECEADANCAPGEVCELGMIEQDGSLLPAQCQLP